MSQRLAAATFKLNLLLRVTRLINDNLSIEELFAFYKEMLVKDFSAGNFFLFMKDTTWRCVIHNHSNDVRDEDSDKWVNEKLYQYKYIDEIEFLNNTYTIIPIFHREKALAYLLVSERNDNLQVHGSVLKNQGFIQIVTNIIVSAVENRYLYEAKLEKESLKKELEVASRMQAILIPRADSLPQNDDINIVSFYAPHFQVGCDYFDFIQLSDTDYGFCIADVSGKGVAAAILMANFQANVRALFKVYAHLSHIVKELDAYINQSLQGEKFITFFIARYNSKTKLLHYINAGHNPPLFWSAEKKRILYCTKGCVGLGMLDHIDHITQGEISVSAGDKLLCYTDGLSEAENNNSEEFGTHEIENAIVQNTTIQGAITQLNTKLQEFLGTKTPSDDILMLGIDFK